VSRPVLGHGIERRERMARRDGDVEAVLELGHPGDLGLACRRGRLTDNIAEAVTGVSQETPLRRKGHFLKADPAHGLGVAERLGPEKSDLPFAAD